jgi:hypothetical protein
VSNKRNRRRTGQRVRSEIDRKPKRATKAMEAFVASLPVERERKESERYWKKPTKAERQEREKRIRRILRLGKPRKVRKPRTKYGRTYWSHSHDV